MTRTRFAPSPTGPLHLGHAYAALYADAVASAQGGTFLLRIEDIDRSRARPHWEAEIDRDLAWLGLDWPKPAMRQSDRMHAYREALERLWSDGLLYPCTCRRRDIEAAASAPQEGAAQIGPDGTIYPGLCRDKPRPRAIPDDCALRLDLNCAAQSIDSFEFHELGEGKKTGLRHCTLRAMAADIGDVVLARRDMGTSYHLAVTVDDAAQGITDVTRGADLEAATPIHVLLQRLLGLPTPLYRHHRLVRDANGKRLAKRDDDRALALYRAEGRSPNDVRTMLGADRMVILPAPR